MYKGIKIAAIIPARKGSKGIPNKNIVNLNGIPLIAHSIIQAKETSIIDKIIVSTDSEEIYQIAKKYNVAIKGLRPGGLSNDTSILYDVLKFEINNHLLLEEGFCLIVLLQPTSPLRQSYMIQDSLKRFIDENHESAVSVTEVKENPIYMRKINEEGKLVSIINMDSTIRRQDLPKFYRINGMIYINKISDILEKYLSLNDNLSPIIISEEYDVDINTIDDLIEAEKKLKQIKGSTSTYSINN